jgi:hypothetical protein
MSDLISRKALLEEIKNGTNKPAIYDGAQEANWIMECINKLPTAYDVDNVVEQLERRKCSKQDAKEDSDCQARNRHIDMCIRVVKGAVKDE